MPRLGPFVRQYQAAIVSRWEEEILHLSPAARLSHQERVDNIPVLVSQLAEAAEAAMRTEGVQLPGEALQEHALHRLASGFDLLDMVAEYSVLCEAVLEVWQAQEGGKMDVSDVGVLNRTLSHAIALSVERFVEVRDRTLRALDRIALAALDHRSVDTSIDATLAALTNALMETMPGVDTVFILLKEEDTLHVRAVAGVDRASVEGRASRVGEGFAGKIAAERRPCLLQEAARSPLLAGSPLRARGTRALYGVPLLDGDDLIGVAHMGSRTQADFSEEDQLVFRSMASRVTGFLAQAQRHEQLRQREEEFRTLAETMPDGVWTADPKGQLTYVNQAVLRLVGATPDRLLAKGFDEFIHPEDVAASVARWAQSVETGEPFEVEYRLRAPDGSYHWHLARARPLKDDAGAVVKWIGTSTEISELHGILTELQQRARLEQLLIGIVSHDLRTPVTSILLNSQILLRQGHLLTRQATAVVRILKAVERASRMIEDLLDFTRARYGSIPVVRRHVNVHDVVRGTVEEVQVAFADRKILVERHGDGEGEWDPDRLAQITSNLIRNALTYSPDETPVQVTTRAEDGAVALEVHNEGEPIPPDKMAHIFEPMQRATAGGEQRNIGLGLYIVSALVKAHGGTVQVQSSREQGTTFTVRLPRQLRTPGLPAAYPIAQPHS